jgi:hypothetical protein
VVTSPEELAEGLFGQVFLHVFVVLPYLRNRGIYPDWDIRATHYGDPPDHRVIPGVLDLAYGVAPGAKKALRLAQIQRHHRQVLGNNWRQLSDIWHDYFRIPGRIIESADAIGSLANTLGVHYRGHDKMNSDSNPVHYTELLDIIRDFLEQRPELQRVFLATDDYRCYDCLQRNLPLQIINLGEVGFHKATTQIEGLSAKGDRAMLDCLLLSRCRAVLKTSSALSGFAKILNPELEIYRISASKRFDDDPYFPDAYIPRYLSSSPEISAVVDRLMVDDWTQGSDAGRYTTSFTSRKHPRSLWRSFRRMVKYCLRVAGVNGLHRL